MKPRKIISLLLCGVLLLCAVIPAFAWEWPEIEPDWDNYVESVTPVGDEPYMKIKLTPKGYVFEDHYLPPRYDVVFKDGSSQSYTISDRSTEYVEGYYYASYFDVDTADGPITLYAAVQLRPGTKQGLFVIGQHIEVDLTDDDGKPFKGYVNYAITAEECRTEIDEGSFIVRVLYSVYSLFQKIRNMFAGLVK